MNKTRKMILLAIMVSQALVLSIVEYQIPLPYVLPGVKLGLANIVTLVVIMFFGYKDALLVVILRCILSSFFMGGPTRLLLSLAGGILSTFVMAFLYKKLSKIFSIMGISVAGSVTHNIGQLLVASIYLKDLSVFTYLPILLISGIIMGCFVGMCSKFLAEALRKTGKMV